MEIRYQVLTGSAQIRIDGWREYNMTESEVLSFIQQNDRSGIWGDEFYDFDDLSEAKAFFDKISVDNRVFVNNGMTYCNFGYAELTETTYSDEEAAENDDYDFGAMQSLDIKTAAFRRGMEEE